MEPRLDLSQYLTFFLGEEEYALGILRVKEIIQYDVVTRVPRTPDWIRGVINLRGRVVPVVDLAVKFNRPATTVGKSTCVVLVEVDVDDEHRVVGLVADAVSQVIDLRPDDIEPPPAFGTRLQVEYLLGMAKLGKKFALILDIDKVLSADERIDAASIAVECAAGAEPPAGNGLEASA